MRARIAIALHFFSGYCIRRGVDHPEVDRFLTHIWEFISLPSDGSGFDDWISREPMLTRVALGDDFSSEFVSLLSDKFVPMDEFRQALSCTAEVLYSTMYGAADEYGSRQYLSELANIATSVGVEWPELNRFRESKWADRGGWGNPPSEQELAAWRSAN